MDSIELMIRLIRLQKCGWFLRRLLYEIWRKRKKMKGGMRLMPGMTRREYIMREKMRRPGAEKGSGPPTTEREGTQGSCVPNEDGLLQSHRPMAAINERWREPRVRTRFREVRFQRCCKNRTIGAF